MNSFGKRHRLLSKKDFNNLKKGSFKKGRDTLVCYYKNNSVDETRIGISISKKIANACMRNRFKRLIRESFRISSYKTGGVDLLLVVKRSKNDIDPQNLSVDTKNILEEVVAN